MPRVFTGRLSLFYQESGSGEPVIFLPGLGADHTAWGYQARALSPRFRCIAVDNRDVGQSDGAGGPYTIRDMAGDVVGLMDALEIPSAHVVGWSMGGAIAQEVAIGWPGRVRRLCLVATYHHGDPRGSERQRAFAQVRRALGLEAYLQVVYPWSFTYRAYQRPGFMEGMRERALANPYPQSTEAYERQTEATIAHEARGRLGQIVAPTLLLVGAEDILTPPERFSQPMAQGIPQARLLVLPEVGHSLLWEQPEAVNRALLEFLIVQGG
ncbi:MAG: alpha/beta fold hydrolase [Chloroflexi bacterium]|nr:alpha/beta fold hydrolase [Chloroflexota bacterium]